MGGIIVVLVFISLYAVGLWLSVLAFNYKKFLGYLTTFWFPLIIVYMFASTVVIYMFPALLVSLIVYHYLIQRGKGSYKEEKAMTFEELVKLKDCFLSFEGIQEPSDGNMKLRIFVNKSDNPTDLFTIPHPDRKVESLQIGFKNYITYSVIFDDFTVWNENDVFRGESFRIYENSDYFDFIKEKSILPSDSLTHYSLACEEHKVDIISKHAPVITRRNPKVQLITTRTKRRNMEGIVDRSL
ncbi:hypothetical protein [Salimicrobium flavidum]|uniref:Uncharacterized protein n=1 Tax=Salimicrobium flavidum TaxID=570947 RepID=A0A1N7KSB3_9BACI|nr:hypothetical protein [Salimicrobium flavidum]SIS64441.1 hypothetical protein SAMN05421687_11714 [Salimicrobium flavidum]